MIKRRPTCLPSWTLPGKCVREQFDRPHDHCWAERASRDWLFSAQQNCLLETKCNVREPQGSASSCLFFVFKILHFLVFCKFRWRTAAFCLTNPEPSDPSTSETSLGLTVSPKVRFPLLSSELLEYFGNTARCFFEADQSRLKKTLSAECCS